MPGDGRDIRFPTGNRISRAVTKSLVMSGPILQRIMHMEEVFLRLCPGLCLNQFTLKFLVLVIDVVISLFQNDHGVHDDTCYHHFPQLLPICTSICSWSVHK
jgi:hypothetical protein